MNFVIYLLLLKYNCPRRCVLSRHYFIYIILLLFYIYYNIIFLFVIF